MPRQEQRSESEAKVNELETKLSGGRRDLELARNTIEDLEKKLSQSSAKINELQGELSNSVRRAELETIRAGLQSKIADLEEKLAASVPRSEAEELRARVGELEGKLSQSVQGESKDSKSRCSTRAENEKLHRCGFVELSYAFAISRMALIGAIAVRHPTRRPVSVAGQILDLEPKSGLSDFQVYLGAVRESVKEISAKAFQRKWTFHRLCGE